MEHLSLAGDFPPATEAEWLALVGKALRNAPFDALRTKLHEGIRTEPLYIQAEKRAPVFATRGWRVIQALTGEETQLNDDIAHGAGAFSIDFGAHPIETAEKLKYFLGSDVPYYIAPGSKLADAALVLAASGQGVIAGSAGLDPLTAVALTGEAPAEKSALLGDYVDAAIYIREHHPAFIPFLASGHGWNAAGGSAVQELAFTLAAAVSYWRALANAGLPLSDAAAAIGFSLTAPADIFLTIAKFRALRLLWARALEAAGEKPAAELLLLAKMPWRILSAYDPHVNLLRGTAAAFGAAIGGATGIELLPFDSAAGGPEALSRRMARNTSLVLEQESHLSVVADAAAGSAYVETLTGDLAAGAWALFREVETKGGLAAAIESGFVQDALHATANGRARAVASRRDKITGVSVFPNLAERDASSGHAEKPARDTRHPFAGNLPELPAAGKGERFAALVAAAGAGRGLHELRLASRRVANTIATPLDTGQRDAEPFETLRRRAGIARERLGSRPPIFLAMLGDLADYRPRLAWVQGFFAAGGIEAIVPPQAFQSVEELAAAFKQSPAPAACLCASNTTYAAMPGAASSLKKAGAVAVYLAGPASILKTLAPEDAVAIDRLIFEGCNVLSVLQEAQAALRVEELAAEAADEATDEGFEVQTQHAHG
jgi:methylmalonyl-CoA mutase